MKREDLRRLQQLGTTQLLAASRRLHQASNALYELRGLLSTGKKVDAFVTAIRRIDEPS